MSRGRCHESPRSSEGTALNVAPVFILGDVGKLSETRPAIERWRCGSRGAEGSVRELRRRARRTGGLHRLGSHVAVGPRAVRASSAVTARGDPVDVLESDATRSSRRFESRRFESRVSDFPNTISNLVENDVRGDQARGSAQMATVRSTRGTSTPSPQLLGAESLRGPSWLRRIRRWARSRRGSSDGGR